MEEITDTQRLDFIIDFRPEMDYDWKSGKHWLVFYTEVHGVKRQVVATSDSYRNAIDKALTDAYVVVE